MNPQRNLLLQIKGLHEVPNCFRWGLHNQQALCILDAGIVRVQNAIDDCLNSLVPNGLLYEIKTVVPGAGAFLSTFERTKRNLGRLQDRDIRFAWQARSEINHALFSLESLLQEHNWGSIDCACMLYAGPSLLFQKVRADICELPGDEDILYCASPLDATIIFSMIEARIIEAVLSHVNCSQLHPQVVSQLGLSKHFFEQDDTGSLLPPATLVSAWKGEAIRGVHEQWL